MTLYRFQVCNSVIHRGHLVCFDNDNNCRERMGQGQNALWQRGNISPRRGVRHSHQEAASLGARTSN